ncbi:pentatricopeptide repeat-containing protein At2g22410, mitochondrial-like [Nymphaea colorata]|uniref:Pentacotripeptide-repeat region of PRORP domain-containing protein n=1 Tax=Nymphaea colorata TaxID=210225 RepID=A0A5K1FEJ9_9MAGN|nr:pentatricopeptide repeat-containing protein At2g22410, mitochondrial-like [Nymphaea colorata]XP_049934941.1 pentatricopeptide repeat-containing protein At2g22410, mitochondrial-like [Nymphaea colorata]XP_049934942.1 pentatricopeptide repeat-containing protein At2g22410, mitochondrial-like [Nymphaea colorata]
MASLRKLHARLVVLGLERDGPSMLNMLSSCTPSTCDLEYACLVFERVEHQSYFIWNTVIRTSAEGSKPEDAIGFYKRMKQRGVQPDNYTFPFALKACSRLEEIAEGRKMHGDIVKMGLSSNVFVQNALIHMYAANKKIGNARQLFDEMPERDLVSWNCLISGYSQNGCLRDVLALFQEMQSQNVLADEITMGKVILACTHLGEWGIARLVVEYIEKNSVKLDMFLCNTLIDMYGRCGCVDDAYKVFVEMSKRNNVSWNAMITACAKAGDIAAARKLFDEMPERDLVSWTAMIAGYSQASEFSEALALFRQMLIENIKPDEITLVSVLSACAHLGALNIGRWIHNYIHQNRVKSDVFLGNALVDMYCKCGSIDMAIDVFYNMPQKDVLSWNSIILGLAVNGRASDALQLFPEMIRVGVQPSDVTFIGILLACSHEGLVDQGYGYFEQMMNVYHLSPQMKHYGCMVDLLSRSGRLDEAYKFILKMPFDPDPVLWRTLLSACAVHGDVELAEITTKRLLVLEPSNSDNYVLLANVYARTGRWTDAMRIREKMKGSNLKKTPGCSSIEVNGVGYREQILVCNKE